MMFAEKLKALRKQKGLTQTQFAIDFNIATGTIGMWETGKRQPDYNTLVKIAKYFDVSINYLLEIKQSLEITNCSFKNKRITRK